MDREFVINRLYGEDLNYFGKPRNKEGTIITFGANEDEVWIRAENRDYGRIFPWECVSADLCDNEVVQLRDLLNDYIKMKGID